MVRGAFGDGPRLVVEEPLGTTTWSTCQPGHAQRMQGVLAWAEDHGVWMRVGILGTLGAFLVGVPLAAAERLGSVTVEDGVSLFRLGIAVTVLPLGWLAPYRAADPRERWKSPFPVHIQALIGTWAVMWLFRLVGLAWLALAAVHLKIPWPP